MGLVQGLQKSKGLIGAALQKAMPRSIKPGYQVTGSGVLKLDSNRQAIQDQYPLQLARTRTARRHGVVGFAPNVDQSFGGLFKKTARRPAARSRPA